MTDYTPYGAPIGPSANVRPDWISDTPVNVDIKSLGAFADAVEGELTGNVRPNKSTLLSRLSGQAGSHFTMYDYIDAARNPSKLGTNPTFGVDPAQATARKIGQYHMECEQQAGLLLEALDRGMQAIASAARTIAENYTSADELNNMDMASVASYFSQEPTSGGLEDVIAEQGGTNPPANVA
ncbi:MAG: hypothetical protein JXA67_13505 [Micromonosporaceae bacterium]|nr:hypothetical protein [Micromonosporaceae bacterium]